MLVDPMQLLEPGGQVDVVPQADTTVAVHVNHTDTFHGLMRKGVVACAFVKEGRDESQMMMMMMV